MFCMCRQLNPGFFSPYHNHYTEYSILALQRLLAIPVKFSVERQAIGKIWSFVTNGSASLTTVSRKGELEIFH